MKILFICGSLESGKDGVGDYTRMLASELIQVGHSCRIVALMDKFVELELEEKQTISGIEIPTMRLPFSNGYAKNSVYAKFWIENFTPEWVVLQYVPFAFHNKGLPIKLSKALMPLCSNAKFAIMFHEIWVGLNDESSIKLKIWGKLQKQIISSFLKSTKPKSVFTQVEFYKFMLSKLVKGVKKIPLFSNIPLQEIRDASKDDSVNISVFGTLFPNSPITDFFEELANLNKNKGHEVVVNFIGRSGNELVVWTDTLIEHGISFKIHGELNESDISRLIGQSNYGIVVTPPLLLEKSGTFATFNQHKIPVISLNHRWSYKKFVNNNSEVIYNIYSKGNLENILKVAAPSSYTSVSDVAIMFLDYLIYNVN